MSGVSKDSVAGLGRAQLNSEDVFGSVGGSVSLHSDQYA